MRDFLATETAGGLLLVGATVVALVWANSPWSAAYETLWDKRVALGFGRYELSDDLRHWVNDGLMAIFFLVVGLEVKRELVIGELRDRRQAALPVAGAIGGMVVPAVVFLALNPTSPEARGWGVPMATDIAFALGILALAAPRIPAGVRLFLLALAIVDDIGAIVVIAVFYSADLDAVWLAGAVAVLAVVVTVRGLTPVPTPVFVGLGVAVWVALKAGGVHATLAGVAMGLLVPVRDVERLEHRLHPLSSLLIVPIFALANAGLMLGGDSVSDAMASSVALGVVAALVAGKLVGITAGAWCARRAGLADLPADVTWSHIVGAAALGGVGFTVSLFIAGLAFSDDGLAREAKLGVLAASVIAAALGAVLLRRATRVH